jgi:hypothetical protein
MMWRNVTSPVRNYRLGIIHDPLTVTYILTLIHNVSEVRTPYILSRRIGEKSHWFWNTDSGLTHPKPRSGIAQTSSESLITPLQLPGDQRRCLCIEMTSHRVDTGSLMTWRAKMTRDWKV